MSLSLEVKELEEICTAYGKVFFLMRKEMRGFECLDDSVFVPKIEYFQTLHLNKKLCYCAFPYDCRYYEDCVRDNCNAEECDNGYPCRRS